MENKEFRLVANNKLFDTYYHCSKDTCYYRCKTKTDMVRHDTEDHGEAKIKSAQKQRGNPESLLELGVRKGFIPKEFENFKQKYIVTFDIECLESEYQGKKEGMDRDIVMAQKIISLAVGSNIPGTQPKFFCRSSSAPEAEEELIQEFIDYLEKLRVEYLKIIPRLVNLPVYIRIYAYIYVHIPVHIRTYTRTYTYIYPYIYVYIPVYIHVHICI